MITETHNIRVCRTTYTTCFRVGASLGLAIGYTLQKQSQRARNVLKIIAKTAWQFEEAEYLERCWIMLAEHYVQSGKQELAYELIKKITTYNLGCSKAHELHGMIAEKDQKYGKKVYISLLKPLFIVCVSGKFCFTNWINFIFYQGMPQCTILQHGM